jgi:hypothetical protein
MQVGSFLRDRPSSMSAPIVGEAVLGFCHLLFLTTSPTVEAETNGSWVRREGTLRSYDSLL